MFCSAGEWFNEDTEAVISQALQTGTGPNVSEAYTINGLPGPLYNCSAKGKPAFNVKIEGSFWFVQIIHAFCLFRRHVQAQGKAREDLPPSHHQCCTQ